MAGVTVGRLHVDCAVPRDHPNPLTVRTRLDEAAQRLPAALGELLAPLARAGDEVVVIRKVELTCDLDTSLQPVDLARVWAARLAAAVAASLDPTTRGTVLRFASEAEHLARFLVDTVAGRAAQTWYYRRWRGLAPLSLAAQLRTALVEEPHRGVAALATLSPSELAALLTALGPREARRVIEATIGAGTAGDDNFERAARVLAPLIPAWLPLATALPSPWQAALALTALGAVALPAAELRSIVALAAALAAAGRRETPSGSPRWPESIAGRGDLPSVAPLLALPAEVRRELAAALGATAVDAQEASPCGRYTRLGGLLLLLPRLAELPLEELFGEDAGCARLALLARASGHARRAEVLGDPLWRRLCGVAADTDIDAWWDGAAAARLAAAMWRRGATRAQRLRAIVTRHACPLLVVAAEPDGEWIALAPLTRELRTAVRRPGVLDVDGVELSAHVTHGTARAAGQMLAWLAPDSASRLELALTVAAQQVLRAFARRLPGFADSSPQFLYDGFLDFDATVVEAEGTFHCRVGRPRLASVFGLTGALRGRLPIGGGRVLELYPAERA